MPIPANVVSLTARPYQVSHLCFPIHGIIENLRTTTRGKRQTRLGLGDTVTAFEFDTFYTGLLKTMPADLSRLIYDAPAILNAASVQASLLMTLRGESTKAVLDKAVNARQNAYFAKYRNQADIAEVMQSFYAASSLPNANVVATPSKPDMLIGLRNISWNQADELQGAYAASPRPLVVETTSSVLQTTGQMPDTTQTIANTDYSYRIPTFESAAQNLRAQVSLVDEQFSQYMASQNIDKLIDVFTRELQNIDLDVERLQIAYLNTILMSPIAGVVTGIYKNAGDWVQAGEPVIRVEDNSAVILVGSLACQGPITTQSTMNVNVTSLFESGTPWQVSGEVISVRGHPGQDNLWDVHALFENSVAPILPINYSFDFDDTTVTIGP